jgi:DUF4097 and DUF4098 domain-containing protein YvlB
MKSKRNLADTLGLILGVAAIVLTAFALIYLLGVRPVGRTIREWVPRHRDWGNWGGAWESEEATEQVQGAFTSLVVNNISGPVKIEGWTGNHIEVHYVKQARGRKALDELRIEIKEEGENLRIRPIYPVSARARFGSVSFEVKVPAGLKELEVHNISGQIEIRNLASDVAQKLETVSGSISTERSGDLWIKSISGSLDFAFAGRSLQARSISGRVGGKIRALEPGGSAELETVSGAVELEAFPGMDATLHLSSVSGSISCDFPVQISEKKEHRLEGRIGQGSSSLNIKTVSGSIRIGQGG